MDDLLPTITLKERDGHVLYTSEILGQYLSIPAVLSTYCLYHCCAHGKQSLLGNLVFLLFSVFVLTGNGMHVSVVMIEKQLKEGNAIFKLVDFLHEVWAHNNFTVGFFSLMILCTWMEQLYASQFVVLAQSTQQKVSATRHSEASSNGVGKRTKQSSDLSNNGHFEMSILKRRFLRENLQANTDQTEPAIAKTFTENTLWKGFIGYLWPALFGVYLSTFSTRTGTEFVTFAFYLAVFILAALIHYKQRGELVATATLRGFSLLSAFYKTAVVGMCVFSCYIAMH